LVDGHHRRLAHELAGRSKILAVVLTEREDDRFEELLAHGAHPLDAYAEIIGTPAPRNFWARPGKETPR
jgi:ParB-like chromosome segregation protein Spo0J